MKFDIPIDVEYLRRPDLKDEMGNLNGKFHIRGVNEKVGNVIQGLCYVSSRNHLDQLNKIAILFMTSPPSNFEEICEQCYCIYEKERKNKMAALLFPGDSLIKINDKMYVSLEEVHKVIDKLIETKEVDPTEEICKVDAVLTRRFKDRTQTDIRLVGTNDKTVYWRPSDRITPKTIVAIRVLSSEEIKERKLT